MRTCFGWRPRSRTSTKRAEFAEAIHAKFPGKLLAYNCSPSFNWKKKLDDADDRERSSEQLECDGLQVPVHHAGRLPRAQLQLLRARARLQGARHDGVRRVPGSKSSRAKRSATRRRATSARSGPATSTKSRSVISEGQVVDHGVGRLDRSRAVLRNGRKRRAGLA